ncbi:AzlC family ABC transporter permease [Sedimenticola hydrogenitrophicus]|uniref:AzlC family ABC transporter permease n=1 Tax=Sedimenticola hydrogenitrophicus TaxID=2967975 RepID=UPI0021A2D114|nr:AzlC family ABC transporter permease [Sedimenticola hydrogenitrophicus]
MSTLAAAFRASVPVMFGYIPLGMAFGILFQDLGYAWYFAPLMGLTVYAGAAQFMAVGLLAAQASLVEVAISTFILNSRHMFFGVSLLARYRARGLRKLYLIFGLTDETYSLITSTHPPDGHDEQNYYLALTALNQGYWVAGCALGALFGAGVEFDTRGMDFVLTALFMVLMLEQWKKLREPYPFAVALLCGLTALWLFREQMLLVSIGLSIALLLLRTRTRQVAS